MSKRQAPLSLDLDNKWSYLKTHGDESWVGLESYLDVVVPRFLDVLGSRNRFVTVFVVGQDAALPQNAEAIRAIASAGHEIGNHSFLHEPWLHLYTPDQLRDDFDKSEEAITNLVGTMPIGFRGPGFSMSQATLELLVRRGYRYDATIFPNALNPVGRAYYFMTSDLSKEEKERRKELFGTFRDARRPNRPFSWQLDGGATLTEVPVTTMPGFRVPIHFSYLIWLAGFSRLAADLYFRTALFLCRTVGTVPSLLLHPLDFLGREDEPDLAFFPGMKMERDRKLELVGRYLDVLGEHYEPVGLATYASGLSSLETRVPDFATPRAG